MLRWEYRPGSTLFFVWQQGREFSSDQPREFSFRHDINDMFSLHPNNTFLIKASYWFNPARSTASWCALRLSPSLGSARGILFGG